MAAEQTMTAAPPETVTPPVDTAPAPATSPTEASPPTTSWRDRLPDGLKSEKTLERFKDEASLAQSYLEIKKWQDGAIKIPGKDAKPEEIAAYREKLGIPKTAAEYKIEVPADAPPGTVIDPQRFAHYAPAFHRLGLTNEQVQGIAEWAMTEQKNTQGQQAEQFAGELDKLAAEWGEAVFNRRAANVQALVRRYASPETVEFLNKSGLTNHPGLFQMLHPIAQQFVEDGIVEPTGDSATTDLASVDSRIDDMRTKYLAAPDGSPERQRHFDELDKLWKLRAEIAGTMR